ncbi:MAG: Hpt domain-containing protein [Treponema sp.]|nr:Hpt domain-containing protein [Treponema sp.]
MQCCPLHDGEDAVLLRETLSALALVEGLDAKIGLFYAGGSAVAYTGMLCRFCAEFERHEAAIVQHLAAQDWKAYSIKLHAMKGLFAAIGVAALSAKAYRLELASKSCDVDTCQKETPEFCDAMRRFKENLCATFIVPPREAGPRTLVEPAVLAEKLACLKRACLEGDSDIADAVSADLGTLSLDGGSDEALDEIRSLADSLDYDEAAEKIDSLLQKLNLGNR